MNTLAKAIQPFVDKNFISGAVALAATKDKILSLEAIGYADLANKKPMTPDTMFWIASMTKPMTGTALMMLVDEGTVKVDDPVEKYLPEFKDQMFAAEKDDDHVLLKKPQHPILVREILNHTSGLTFSSTLEVPTFDVLPLSYRVRSYTTSALLFEPGTKYSYSNAGTNTCGRIIEVVSGLSYETFMDRHIFGPLGMNDTTFWPNDEQVSRMAKIYRSNADKTGIEESNHSQLAYPLSDTRRKAMPAGGLFSTAGDCLKFCQMVLNGGVYEGRRYLSETAVREMTRRQTAPEIETGYGFGWSAEDGKYGHGGAYKTNMTIHAKTGLITVFLIQHCTDWHTEEGEKLFPAFVAAAEELIR